MTPKAITILIGSVLLLGVGVSWYERHEGAKTQRLADQQQFSDSLARVAQRSQDSLAKVQAARDDSSAKQVSHVLQASQQKVDASARQTNAAIQTASQAAASARRALADTAVRIDSLRRSLQGAVDALVADSVAFAAERLAYVAARKADSTAFSDQIKLLKLERAQSDSAGRKSLDAVKAANLADVALAGHAGTARGRIEGVAATLLLEVALGGIYKAVTK